MPDIEYSDGETTFEGYITEPPTTSQPCVLVAHAWDGLNPHWVAMADSFRAKGYVGFAIDAYGKGKRGRADGDNSHLMNPMMEDRALLGRRLLTAFEFAKSFKFVRADRVAILGYCFGGLCALDLARASPSGLVGAISIHGALGSPNIAPQEKITSSVLVLHGWEDPFAPQKEVLTFADEMTRAGADWQIHAYGHAKHGFTFVGADIPQFGIKYDANSHRRSQQATDRFLREVFGDPEA
jgi:dienelactone hydrolase